MTEEKKLRIAQYRGCHADQAERSGGLVAQGKRAEELHEERQNRRQKRREEEERRRKVAEAAAKAKAAEVAAAVEKEKVAGEAVAGALPEERSVTKD